MIDLAEKERLLKLDKAELIRTYDKQLKNKDGQADFMEIPNAEVLKHSIFSCKILIGIIM